MAGSLTGGGVGPITGPPILSGEGSPEGLVTAQIGALYRRTDGGNATTLYVKESGTDDTGWVPLTGEPPPRDVFVARLSANQSIAANTWTKVLLPIEGLDQNNKYNTSTSRWTPSAGALHVGGALYMTAGGSTTVYIGIYKNGALISQRGPGTNSVNILVVDNANGTDYYECWGYSTAANTIDASPASSWFQGVHL